MWTPLTPSFIKVNIDKSFLGDSNIKGIDGVFRNSKGRVLLEFGREVSVDSTVHVEVLALREGLLVVATSRWVYIVALFPIQIKLLVNSEVGHGFVVNALAFSRGLSWMLSCFQDWYQLIYIPYG